MREYVVWAIERGLAARDDMRTAYQGVLRGRPVSFFSGATVPMRHPSLEITTGVLEIETHTEMREVLHAIAGVFHVQFSSDIVMILFDIDTDPEVFDAALEAHDKFMERLAGTTVVGPYR